eukprot:241432_1
MSFRRRKSRIGPSFQAVVPVILTSTQRQELHKLYDYEQSLSEHCLTLSSLSAPLHTTNAMNNSNSNQSSSPSSPSDSNTIQPQSSPIHGPFTVRDTTIDHKVDPTCLDMTKTHPPPHLNYASHVQQYQIYPHPSLQSKVDKFKPNSNQTRKRKHLDDEPHHTDAATPFIIPPPPKKQKLQHIPPLHIPTIPTPFLPSAAASHALPPFPIQLNKPPMNPNDTLRTPSPPHKMPHIVPNIPPLPHNIMHSQSSNTSSSPSSPVSLRTPQSVHSISLSNTKSPLHPIPMVIPPTTVTTHINHETTDKKKKKKKKKNDNNIHRHQHKHPDNTSHDDTPLRSSEITHHGVKQQTNTCPPTASTPKESNTSRAPLPSNTNTNLSTPHTMPPPPSFLPSFPIQQPPTRTALSSSHLPTIGAMPLPPPPYPYTHGPYANPHISYTHYNPQFYYMHTTYNYAPPKPTKTINPKLIKKQRIDNKSCEVIDLSDDRSPTVTNYQYAPYPTAIPGMPMAPMPMPMPHFPLIPTAPHPMMQLQHPIKAALLTPPPAMVPSLSNHESSSSVSSVATHSSLSTPTNIDREESEYKTMKRKVVSDKQNVRKKGGKVVNNNIQIKRKHVDLFESLLTPKATSNSSINSSIIHRALQQEESNTEYQKLDNHNKKSKGKKGKKRRKPPPHNPYMVPIHAYAPHPFPLPTQMIPIPMMPPHLPPMIVPNMTMPHIGMTPFVLAPRRMEHTEKEMDVDALFGEMQRDLKVNEEYCDRMPVLQVQLRQSSEEDEDEKRRKRKKKKKKRKKHKKKRKKHHKKKGKKKTIKSENITLDSEMNNDEIKMNEAMSNGTMSDANVMSGYPPHPHHPNMFSNFNVSPPNPCNFNIHRSASPPFGLSDDDLYCGSLPFRSPEFGGTAFYENDSPLMPVDIDRHSPPPSYS